MKAAIVINKQTHPPFTHDLRRLAKQSGIEFDQEFKNQLDTITTFNLNARYDDYKQEFYKKCTSDYAKTWISNIKELREWIKTKL